MDVANPGHASALWVGLHILLMLVLSLLVVQLRNKHKVFLGDEGIPELAQAIRAFGNATESPSSKPQRRRRTRTASCSPRHRCVT